MGCKNIISKLKVEYFQLFPMMRKKTVNFKNININKNQLLESLQKKCKQKLDLPVYSYIIDTIKNKNYSLELYKNNQSAINQIKQQGDFIQFGSAPNFQGGIISLCTCKHLMRTWQNTVNWPTHWIAGFTGVSSQAGNGENYLIYLMKVEYAFDSFYDLWYSNLIQKKIKGLKNSRNSSFGDFYEPLKNCTNSTKYNYQHYNKPISSHVHSTVYQYDINSVYNHKHSSLLLGDNKLSFLWNTKLIKFNKNLYCNKHPRTKKWESLSSFLGHII